MIIFVKDEDDVLVIPVGLGPNVGENKTVLEDIELDSSTAIQIVTPDEGIDGFSKVTVNPVTSSIDDNIQAENIKEGVTILGVEGSYEGGSLQAKTVDSSTVQQQILPDSSYYGLSSVTVNPYSQQKSNSVIEAKSGIDTDVSEIRFLDITTGSQYYYLFRNCTSLYGALNLSEITNILNNSMYCTFYGCTNITSLDLSSLTIIEGNHAAYEAFRGCTGLTGHLDLSNLQTILDNGSGYSTIYPVDNMFYNCNFTSVDLRSFDGGSGPRPVNNMFHNCTNIEYVDLSSFNYVSTNKQNFFNGCTGLRRLKIHHKGTYLGTTVFSGGTAAGVQVIEYSDAPVRVGIGDCDLTGFTGLNAQGVYNILSSLDTTASFGRNNVIFDPNGITVTDFEDGRIQSVYDNVVASGLWIVQNLTILPYGS